MNNTIKKIPKTLKHARWLLGIGIILIIITPFILTRHTFWKIFNFTQTGAIGDTIGGITAPIVNLVGAILVYLALKAQIDANKIVQTQLDEQKNKDKIQNQIDEINQLYFNLKDSIDNFNYVSLESCEFGSGQYLTGSEAIYRLFNDFYCDNCHLDDTELKGNPKITELISVLKICDVLMTKIDSSEIPNKDVMRTLTCHQFRYRVIPRLKFDSNKLSKHFCESCNMEHGLPENMVNLIQKLNNCTIINGS